MKRFALIILAIVAGAGAIAWGVLRPGSAILCAMGSVLLTAAILIAVSAWDRRSESLLRLDWFLPPLRRSKADEQIDSRVTGRWLRNIVPSSWRSNHQTKQRGAIRHGLRKLGISWLASPPRRVVQTISFVLFSLFFFYVCWPYSAKPAAEPRTSSKWSFTSVDQESGVFSFDHQDAPPAPWLAKTSDLYVQPNSELLDPFPLQALALEEGRITLLPRDELSTSQLDAILFGQDQWTFYDVDPLAWPSHYADNLNHKEHLPAETFLIIDPLVSLSTAVASRSWVWSLVSAAVILVVCLLIPRGFCGYLCPLGTTIDLFDWAVTSRTNRFRVAAEGWWVHIKYYLLAGTLIAALCGVLVSGFVAAIPVITRAMLFLFDPLQSGAARGWHLVPAMNAGHFVSIALFFTILGLGFFRPRFWCKYVCPSGAVFSLGNLIRVTERKVESSCIHCNKCVEICPFDAIKPDFTTRGTDCTMCQSCGGVCPTHAIKFVERWNGVELKVQDEPPTHETAIGRRGFLSLAVGSSAAAVGGIGIAGTTKVLKGYSTALPIVRPPGSIPEEQFLQMCIRCGECFKACPNNVLQPESFQQGLDGLWTPLVEADWAGCESSCNACGQVCPTGAIRALPLEEKKVARIGLAVVNESTCLPLTGTEDCDLCVQECNAAGYNAIEYVQVGTEVDENGAPIKGTGMLAPMVIAESCVGCGLCQTRCFGINVKQRSLLKHSAIIVKAGEGKEDRILSGSYQELRRQRESKRPQTSNRSAPPNDERPTNRDSRPAANVDSPFRSSDPDSPSSPSATPDDSTNPFGVESADNNPFGL